MLTGIRLEICLVVIYLGEGSKFWRTGIFSFHQRQGFSQGSHYKYFFQNNY